MTENIEINQSKSRFYKWLTFILLVSLVVFFFFFLKSKNERNQKFNDEVAKLNNEIKRLENYSAGLQRTINEKSSILSSFSEYLPLINNLKLSDSAYKSLPYRFGQQVRILPDSLPAVINSITITSNQYEYAVKYLVRTSKGEYSLISIGDILKPVN